MKTENVVEDTIFTFEQMSLRAKERLQISADLFVKEKILVFKNEELFAEDLLKDQESVKRFASNLIFQRYPNLKYIPDQYYIGEDNSKKLWFFYTNYPNTFDGGIYLIVVKNNCRVLFFNNFCCPL